VAAAPVDVAVVAVAVEVGRVQVVDVALRAADKVVARGAKAADAAVRAAVDAVKAKAVTAMADAEMAEVSSLRT
jgi:Zn finger protein HypA/HybF involved in hydrogenase expression